MSSFSPSLSLSLSPLDKKIDDDDDTFTNTSSSQTDKESKLTQLASPAQPVAREQPHVAREEPTEPNKEPLSDDPVKSALAIMASKPPQKMMRKDRTPATPPILPTGSCGNSFSLHSPSTKMFENKRVHYFSIIHNLPISHML